MNAETKITASLHSAMAAAFGEIEGATKGVVGQVGQQKYKYADIGAVIDAIKPALIRHGLFFTQHPHPSEDGVTVETVLHHASGESIGLGSLFVPANKRDAQGFGSALTYARRYALVTAFGVPTEDDDGNAAVRGGQGENRAVSPPAAISDAEWGIITDLITQTNTDAKAFCEAFKIASVKGLPSSEFDRARAMLNKKLAAKEPA